MWKPVLSLLLVAFVFTACAKNKKSSAQAPATQAENSANASAPTDAAPEESQQSNNTNPIVNNPLQYEYGGQNYNGDSCTTGAKSFETIHELCVTIQDETKNNDCALSDRISHFNAVCSPLGYDFLESLSCEFALLDRNALIEAPGNYNPKDLLYKETFCTGRNSKGEDIKKLAVYKPAVQNLWIESKMEFVPRKQWNNEQRSNFEIKVLRQLKAGVTKEEVSGFSFEDGFKSVYGYTYSMHYKYVIRCRNVAACQ